MISRPHPGTPFFAAIADRLGEQYLRYSFTKGTEQEVDFLIDLCALRAGDRVLDVGCGPGRHAVELARRGIGVTGIDISERFLEVAAARARAAGVGASFFEVDARQMPFDSEFDAVVSLCQGGFGLMGQDDGLILRRMMEAARPGAHVVVSAVNAYFTVRNIPEGASFDAAAGLLHERAPIKDASGAEVSMDMWTTAYTPRELSLLALGVGLVPDDVWSVEPGAYARRAPDTETPELLLVAHRPSARV